MATKKVMACVGRGRRYGMDAEPPDETRPPTDYRSNHEIVVPLGDHGPWEKQFQAQLDDLEGMS